MNTISSKYDKSYYLVHRPVTIYKRGEYQPLGEFYESNLLMIKWEVFGTNGLAIRSDNSALTGTLRMRCMTPFGEKQPKDYQLAVSRKPFIQFLEPQSDLQYSFEALNPDGIEKTRIEIWEYQDPVSYSRTPTEKVDNQNIIIM